MSRSIKKREFSPYAVTQLRGILHRLKAVDRQVCRLRHLGPERDALDDQKRDLMREAKLVGFSNTIMRALSRNVRKRDLTLATDEDLVALAVEVVQELDGRRRSIVLAKSHPIDSRILGCDIPIPPRSP